jgi:hypothetical protein
MRSLASLLEGAVRRAAFEVRLESGQPVVYTTARGTEAEASVLPRPELFDMIEAAVDGSQQIELAVGNPVEFVIDAGAKWSVSAEPGQNGITVLATRPGGPTALPLLDDPSAGIALELEEPDFDVGHGSRPSSPSGDFAGVPASPAPAFESGTWTLDDDDELDVGLDEPDEDSLPTGFAKAGSVDRHIGVPADDDDDGGDSEDSDPFSGSRMRPPPDPAVERRHTLSPTVKAMQASPPAIARPHPPGGKPPAGKPDAEISQRITQRELGAMRAGDGATQRELASIDVGDGLIADVAEGTLVYVLEPGFADVLARSSQAPVITIDDPHDGAGVWTRVRELPPGAIVVVRCEDPSTLLDGILRRLEEGYRVFVETRARTVEGARRILLGISATERAERWLDAQLTLIVEPGEGGARLVPARKG